MRPPANARAPAPVKVATSQPAATIGPTPGMAMVPSAARRPAVPPATAPIDAPVAAASGASVVVSSAVASMPAPRFFPRMMLTSLSENPAASRSRTAASAALTVSNMRAIVRVAMIVLPLNVRSRLAGRCGRRRGCGRGRGCAVGPGPRGRCASLGADEDLAAVVHCDVIGDTVAHGATAPDAIRAEG